MIFSRHQIRLGRRLHWWSARLLALAILLASVAELSVALGEFDGKTSVSKVHLRHECLTTLRASGGVKLQRPVDGGSYLICVIHCGHVAGQRISARAVNPFGGSLQSAHMRTLQEMCIKLLV